MSPDVTSAGLADAVLLLHVIYVAFVVGGLLLILAGWWRNWEWTRHFWFRWLHLAAVGFVMLESWLGIPCPLTALESYLRRLAGAPGYATSFIGDWLQRFIFYQAPDWMFIGLYTVFALLVIVVFIFYPPQRYPRRRG